MKENEEGMRSTDTLEATTQIEKCLDTNAMSGTLTDGNMPLHEVEGELVEKYEVVCDMQSDNQKLLELFGKTNGEPSKLMAELCSSTIRTAVALTKLALFLVWHTRSYVVYGCKTMKDYIQLHTNITYDAGIKQLEAAKICAEHFGLKRIGDFSDNALRTMARLDIRIQRKVIDEICNELNVSRETISSRKFTAKRVEQTTRKVTGRLVFTTQYKQNFLDKDVCDINYLSISSVFLDGKSSIYGIDEMGVNHELDSSVAHVEIDYSDSYLNHSLRLKHSELELREIIKEQFQSFYFEYVYNKFLSRSELIMIIISLGQKKLNEESVVELLNKCYRINMFENKEHAYESLSKYSKKILYLLLSSLSERGEKVDDFDVLPLINEDEVSSGELIELIINKYNVFDKCDLPDSTCNLVEAGEGKDDEDEDEDEDDDDDDDDENTYESVEELMEQPFFVDTDSNDVMESYEKSRMQLQESIDRKIYDDLLLKNPKAGVLMALVDELALEELGLARQYIEFTYDKLAEESSLDAKHGTIEVGDN